MDDYIFHPHPLLGLTAAGGWKGGGRTNIIGLEGVKLHWKRWKTLPKQVNERKKKGSFHTER